MADGDPYTAPTDPIVGQATGTESSLSNWVGPYVTDMLGKGWALSDMPYEAYNGPLTAGTAPLQDQAFGGIAGLTAPDSGYQYDPNQYGTDLFTDPGMAESYMNPFIQQVLNPQMDEMRRQSEIQRNMDASRLTKAGAFGGSRQAIMDAERVDNTGRLMNEITGTGYRDAYDKAADVFRTDEERQLDAARLNEESAQFGAGQENLDFENAMRLIQGQSALGDQQRNIMQEGISADRAQFEEERDYPYKQVQYMQSLLQGLPMSAQNTSYGQASDLSNALSSAGGILALLQQFNQE